LTTIPMVTYFLVDDSTALPGAIHREVEDPYGPTGQLS